MSPAELPPRGSDPPGPTIALSVSGSVPSNAHAAGFVRHAVVDLLARYGTPAAQVGMIGLAISEAVTNVAVHAYPFDGVGCVHFDADIEDDDLEIVVRDDGFGIRHEHRNEGVGLGLRIIAATASDFALTDSINGLELWMRFALGELASSKA